MFGPGRNAAVLATFRIAPVPRSSITGNSRRVSSVRAVMFTWMMFVCDSSESVATLPLAPSPALLISVCTSMRRARSSAASTRHAVGSPRSAGMMVTFTRCRSHSAATARSPLTRRATSTRSKSSAAAKAASSAPMPLEAPVTRQTSRVESMRWSVGDMNENEKGDRRSDRPSLNSSGARAVQRRRRRRATTANPPSPSAISAKLAGSGFTVKVGAVAPGADSGNVAVSNSGAASELLDELSAK